MPRCYMVKKMGPKSMHQHSSSSGSTMDLDLDSSSRSGTESPPPFTDPTSVKLYKPLESVNISKHKSKWIRFFRRSFLDHFKQYERSIWSIDNNRVRTLGDMTLKPLDDRFSIFILAIYILHEFLPPSKSLQSWASINLISLPDPFIHLYVPRPTPSNLARLYPIYWVNPYRTVWYLIHVVRQ